MPSRGEVWLVDLGMIEKVRPALVVSGPSGADDRDIITIIPHTTTVRGSRFEIDIPLPFLRAGAFVTQSPTTIPIQRAIKLLGRVTNLQMRKVEDSLIDWLQLAGR